MGKGGGHNYVLVDTGQLPRWPDGRECPCVLVLSFFFIIVIAEDSARSPQAWFLAAMVSFIADGRSIVLHRARAGVILEDGRFVQREHLAQLAEGLEVSLGDTIVGLVAFSIAVCPSLCEIVCERVESTAIFNQSRDIYLGANEVADRASVVVKRGCE